MSTPIRRTVCVSCEGEITSLPVFRRDEVYCCTGCAEGGPCICLYEQDLADDGVDHLGLPFAMPEADAEARESEERVRRIRAAGLEEAPSLPGEWAAR